MNPVRKKTLKEKLWDRCVRNDATGCLLYTGKLARGYGHIWHNGKGRQAHRLAWEDKKGPIPAGVLILHSCDVRNCVETEHLFTGDQQANMDDMMNKGRDRHREGSLHGMSKLTETQVIEIRALNGYQRDIAKQFGVSPSLVSLVRRREIWRHV